MSQDTLFPLPEPEEPGKFDFDGWLQNAHLPEESTTVYQRPDVIAELSDLKRRIELEDRASGGERSAADSSLSALEKEYEDLLQTFSRSALTIYVRALSDDEISAQRKETELRTKDMDSTRQNFEFGVDLLAAAVVAVRPAGGERTPIKFNRDQVYSLRSAIGDVQISQVLQARMNAQNAVPAVDADFLHNRSGSETGQE